MNNIARAAIFTAAVLGLAACNTVEGAGKDVEAVGQGTQDVANEVKEDMTD